MSSNRRSIGAIFCIALVVACNTTPAPTATPFPPTAVPIAHNADWKPVTQTINSFEMVEVPPGCFLMGGDDGRRDEKPVTQICFNASFWIDKYDVTNAQYGSAGAYPGPNHPRENLTWVEARDFCKKRGARLPTEAEWEYAARGPDDLLYPWGNTLIADNLVFDRNMNNNETADIGSRPAGASWVGALDMSGNVWQWVSSIYQPYPYDAKDGRENDADTTSPRVYRGGWLSYNERGVSGVMRYKLDPANGRDWHLGFRCAMSSTGGA